MCHIFRDARKLSLSSSAMGNELLSETLLTVW